MCGTMAYIALAAAAVSSYAKYKQGQATAEALQKAFNIKSERIEDRASQKAEQRVEAARRERARIRVAAGETGLSLTHGSVAQMLLDSRMQQMKDVGTVRHNLHTLYQANKAQTQSRMNQIQIPTFLSAGLHIAGAGYSAYYGMHNG